MMLICVAAAQAGQVYVVEEADFIPGTSDWLADVRFRNFNSTISDYEMMVNASPTRTIGQNQVNGQVPGPYAFADWAESNAFTVTYDPSANSGAGWVSLRLVGTGDRDLGSPGGYDVTIGRAPDAVSAGAVNYIQFQLWDRVNFPTFPYGVTLSSLDGQNLGTLSLSSSGIGTWYLLDPDQDVLSNGFVLSGQFDLDLDKLAEGKEGDKIIFAIGHNSAVATFTPTEAVPLPGAFWLGGTMLMGLAGIRRYSRREK